MVYAQSRFGTSPKPSMTQVKRTTVNGISCPGNVPMCGGGLQLACIESGGRGFYTWGCVPATAKSSMAQQIVKGPIDYATINKKPPAVTSIMSTLGRRMQPPGCICRPHDPCGTKPAPILPEGKVWCTSGCPRGPTPRCQAQPRIAQPSLGSCPPGKRLMGGDRSTSGKLVCADTCPPGQKNLPYAPFKCVPIPTEPGQSKSHLKHILIGAIVATAVVVLITR